ncbi:type III-B CRISPR module-associated protein Cmr3 [Paenibacillus chitinolyticus]|uniref:type III-B CRISPR module-associated protein Cmr3 n=1 Tax=Paenibacillus chitinolyticus TaxID=79263 RepID=UPI00366C9BAD
MFYAIDAVDTFFFRNASPFDADLSQSASSLFPPFPSVYAGALRYADTTPGRSSSVISRALKIGFSGLMVDGRLLLPRPLDTWVSPSFKLERLSLVPSPVGSSPLPYCLTPVTLTEDKEVEPRGGGYVEEADLSRYLEGADREALCLSLSDFVKREGHVGIQIDRSSGSSRSGLWYSIEKVRPVDACNRRCSLVVEAEGVSVDTSSSIKLGGEARAASIRRLEREESFAPVTSSSRYFKLYLAAPAIFKQGWLPWWIDPVTKEGVFAYKKHRIRVRLLSAAIGRHVAVGGFSMEKRHPKEMRYAVPAGSVYFFEIIEGEFKDAVKLFHRKCVSDYREGYGFVYRNWDRMRYCDRGYGYSLVGTIGAEQGGVLNV